MIVSHAHKFVFVAVPKTGSQAVRAALRPVLGPHDWEQCTLFEKRQFPVPDLAALETGHVTLAELRPYLLPEMWRDYRRFAFIRDPFVRFRSLIRFWYPPEGPAPTLDDCKRVLTDPEMRIRRLVRPQADYLVDGDGAMLADWIGCHGRIAADFGAIAAALKLPPLTLPVRNVSARTELPLAFDAELEGMIADFYRADFALRVQLPQSGVGA